VQAKEIKEKFSVPDVANELGLEIVGDKTFCLFHDEATMSMHLYEEHWYSYCCGEIGDVLKLVMSYYDCSFRRAIHWFIDGQTDEDIAARPTVKLSREKVVTDLSEMYDSMRRGVTQRHEDMVLRRWPYLSAHGAWPGTPFEGGWMNAHWDGEDRVVGIKLRHFDGSKSAVPGSTFSAELYYPKPPDWGRLDRDYPSARRSVADPAAKVCGPRTMVLCEGETDAHAMLVALGEWSGTAIVAGLPGGASKWDPGWVGDSFREVYVCMDNDRAGRSALDTIRRSVGWDRVRELKVPGLYADACEALDAGWSPTLR